MLSLLQEHASGVELREHEDSEYKEDKTGSANQSSATGPVIVHEVGRNGNYIRLRNTLSEVRLFVCVEQYFINLLFTAKSMFSCFHLNN